MEPDFVTACGWKLYMITTITEKSTWGDAKFKSPDGQTGGIYWENTQGVFTQRDPADPYRDDTQRDQARMNSPNSYRENPKENECFLTAPFDQDGSLYSWQVENPPGTEAELFSLFENVWVPHLKTLGIH